MSSAPSHAAAPGLPPLRTMLKSKDVEDPVNLYVHRTLAYLFVLLTFRTPLTPNGITFLSLGVGIGAGLVWWLDGPLVLGAVMLWTSAILDGADGMMARAKSMFSASGRALDGSADLIVAAITVSGAVYRVRDMFSAAELAILAAIGAVTAVLHFNLYDYYKDLYLRAVRGGKGEATLEAELEAVAESLKGSAWYLRAAVIHGLIPYTRRQAQIVRRSNPQSLLEREALTNRGSEQLNASYRSAHRGPMRLWPWISLAPHTYLLCLAAIFGRIDLFIWYRIVVANALFVVLLLWERRATRQVLTHLPHV